MSNFQQTLTTLASMKNWHFYIAEDRCSETQGKQLMNIKANDPTVSGLRTILATQFIPLHKWNNAQAIYGLKKGEVEPQKSRATNNSSSLGDCASFYEFWGTGNQKAGQWVGYWTATLPHHRSSTFRRWACAISAPLNKGVDDGYLRAVQVYSKRCCC